MGLKHLTLLPACGLYTDYAYNIHITNFKILTNFCFRILQMKQKLQSTLSKESSNSFRVNRLTLLGIAAKSRSKYGQTAIFKKCAVIKMNHKVLHLQNAIL